jgi:hypothetical protein
MMNLGAGEAVGGRASQRAVSATGGRGLVDGREEKGKEGMEEAKGVTGNIHFVWQSSSRNGGSIMRRETVPFREAVGCQFGLVMTREKAR